MSALATLLAVSAQATLPPWPATWKMNESTIMMPCNYSGLFDPHLAGQFGVVDFDWSNGKQLWANAKPMDCAERLVTQAAEVKAVSPHTKVFVYRNIVKALPWYTGVREKLSDPRYAGWFLRFKEYKGPSSNLSYHVPACTGAKCSGFYHDQDQTPEHPHGDGSCVDDCDCGDGIPCGEYLFDHRNASLRKWLLQDFIGGPEGIQNPNVDGFYLDDGWSSTPEQIEPWMPKDGFCSTCEPGTPPEDCFGGPTEEEVHCVQDMGLSRQDVADITTGWKHTMELAQAAIVKAGGFNWQLFKTVGTPANSTCAAEMRTYCQPDAPILGQAVYFGFTDAKASSMTPEGFALDVASFLLVRGPYAWLGYGWSGCTSAGNSGPNYVKYGLPASTQRDYGVPVGTCKEVKPGVFTREYKAESSTGVQSTMVSLDCNTYTPSITTESANV